MRKDSEQLRNTRSLKIVKPIVAHRFYKGLYSKFKGIEEYKK